MANKEKNFVFVVSGSCGDRHTGPGDLTPKVFSTKQKAVNYIVKDAKTFIADHYGANDEGGIDYDTIDYITGEPDSISQLGKAVKENDEMLIDIDNEGTFCHWDLNELPIL